MNPAKTLSLVAMASFGALALGASRPALAFDEGRGSLTESLMTMFGISDDKEKPAIDYRERAPLVLPPKTELRQPAPRAAQRVANWPEDQEITAARKRDAELRRRPLRMDDGAEILTAKELKETGRIRPEDRVEKNGPGQECSIDPGATYACDPNTTWKKLAVKKEEKLDLKAGVEPERRYLTQPPKGYMKATRDVKPTFEPRPIDGPEIATDYYRNKPKRDE